ncbi:MAG: hypothetical protein ACRDLR_03535 [Gaiellaceae bacterium]
MLSAIEGGEQLGLLVGLRIERVEPCLPAFFEEMKGGVLVVLLTEQGVYLDGGEAPAQRKEGTQAGCGPERRATPSEIAARKRMSPSGITGRLEGPNGELDWPNIDRIRRVRRPPARRG